MKGMLDSDWLEKAAEKRRLNEALDKTSVGWALQDIRDRGIEAHLETLEDQLKPPWKRKKP